MLDDEVDFEELAAELFFDEVVDVVDPQEVVALDGLAVFEGAFGFFELVLVSVGVLFEDEFFFGVSFGLEESVFAEF